MAISRETDLAIGRLIARLGHCPPVIELGDLYPGRVRLRPFQSLRLKQFKFHEWLKQGRHFGYIDGVAAVAGTAFVWNSAGGSGGGGHITCTSLAAGTGSSTTGLRQGDKSTTFIVAPPNGTAAVLPAFLQVWLSATMVSAPAAGGEINVRAGFSDSGTAATDNPAGLTGADGTGPNYDTLPQLADCGSVIASANITGNVMQQYLSRVPPLDAFLSPVIYNNMSVAFDATAAHTTLKFIPYWWQRQV